MEQQRKIDVLTSRTAIEILKLVRTQPGITLSQIARRINRSPGSVHRHLVSLAEAGVLVADREDGRKEVYYTIARGKSVRTEYSFGTMTIQFH